MTPSRPYLTFSLRTLFVLTGAIALWLGVIAERAREQREAVKAIEALGGSVAYDWQLRSAPIPTEENPNGPAWLRQLIGEDYFQEVEMVSLMKSPPKTEPTELDIRRAIPYLQQLRGLRWVFISKYRQKNAESQLKTALPDCEVFLAIDGRR